MLLLTNIRSYSTLGLFHTCLEDRFELTSVAKKDLDIVLIVIKNVFEVRGHFRLNFEILTSIFSLNKKDCSQP